jgi:hypothetical protein
MIIYSCPATSWAADVSKRVSGLLVALVIISGPGKKNPLNWNGLWIMGFEASFSDGELVAMVDWRPTIILTDGVVWPEVGCFSARKIKPQRGSPFQK